MVKISLTNLTFSLSRLEYIESHPKGLFIDSWTTLAQKRRKLKFNSNWNRSRKENYQERLISWLMCQISRL